MEEWRACNAGGWRRHRKDGAGALNGPDAHILPATQTPPPALFGVLARGLQESSLPITGPVSHQWLAVPLQDDDGQIIGGLWGSTLVGWLNIEMLFIPASMRRQGVGRALLHRAEAEARRRGCRQALVDTFDTGAAAFYEGAGYERFAELPGFPPGHRRLYYRKTLTE